jgi:hypothetical protein
MKLQFTPQYEINLDSCRSAAIFTVFTKLLPLLIADLYHLILVSFGERYMKEEEKPFTCACGNNKNFIWKTKAGKLTGFQTMWGDIKTHQLQVQCKCCNKKMFITRTLLEMAPRQKISREITRKLALVGALASYRCATKISRMFGSTISKSTVWRSVQSTGKEIVFDLDQDELAEGMADGTGIPIQGIKKRGRELKVFAQKTLDGGIRIAGIGIGKYKNGWDKVFAPLQESFEKMGKFHMILDGDSAILKGFAAKIEITVQRCLWHIPHSLKHYLWEDKIATKSELWLDLMAQATILVSLPSELPEEQELIQVIMNKKEEAFTKLLYKLEEEGATRSLVYLENAWDDMFTSLQKKLNGKTTSLIERLMRTVNLRINLGKWKEEGALNLLKVRLSYYYNDEDFMPKTKEYAEVQRIAS